MQANDPINTYLDALRAAIKAAHPQLLDVAHHAGDIDEKEFARIQQRTPAAHIALGSIGALRNRADGAAIWPLTLVCYLLTRDTRVSAPQAAYALTQSIINVLRTHTHKTEYTATTAPTHISARNVRGDTTSKVSLWAVRCELELIVGPAIYPGTGPVVTGLDVERIND